MVLDWLPKETKQAIDRLDLALSVYSVPEIDILLSKTVLFRGKKFRPTLCFLMGQALGVPLERLHPYARAAEFVHAATLAHDDVIDESPTRRHRPTLNARSSNARAVLAGDLLLARVMSELASLGQIDIIADLANTVEELVSGEWLQLEARKIARVNRQHLETVSKKKTASLMAWCGGTAARLAGKSQSWVDLGRQFGESLGVAFQMIDDIIDFDPAGEKPFAQDIREGLVNFVTLEMIEARPSLLEPIQRLLGAVSDSPEWPWEASDLEKACSAVRSRADAKLEGAGQILDQLAQPPEANAEAVKALRSILIYLRERVR